MSSTIAPAMYAALVSTLRRWNRLDDLQINADLPPALSCRLRRLLVERRGRCFNWPAVRRQRGHDFQLALGDGVPPGVDGGDRHRKAWANLAHRHAHRP